MTTYLLVVGAALALVLLSIAVGLLWLRSRPTLPPVQFMSAEDEVAALEAAMRRHPSNGNNT